MGREIRMVAPNWEHPTKEYLTMREGYVMRFRPLHNEAYEDKIEEWIKGRELWMKGEHPDQTKDYLRGRIYEEYAGGAPQREDYRPKWAPGEATWFQVYETVSEGTPCSPPCATKEEIIEWLVKHGDTWDKDGTVRCNPYAKPWHRKVAEAFAKEEWSCSMVIENGVIKTGAEALVDP
jgi:hypothetical protein